MTVSGPRYRALALLVLAAAVFIAVAHYLAKIVAMETSYEASVLIMAAIGFVALAVYELYRLAPSYLEYGDGVARRVHPELAPEPIDPSWVISGSPVFRGCSFQVSERPASRSGLWECTGPGQFRWEYNVDEAIYVLEGSADIEYLGNRFTLSAGDSTKFIAGTSAKWTVPNRIKKTFRIYDPGRLTTRLMRRLFPPSGGA